MENGRQRLSRLDKEFLVIGAVRVEYMRMRFFERGGVCPEDRMPFVADLDFIVNGERYHFSLVSVKPETETVLGAEHDIRARGLETLPFLERSHFRVSTFDGAQLLFGSLQGHFTRVCLIRVGYGKPAIGVNLVYWKQDFPRSRTLSRETPKQKLRRLLDRLPVDADKKRDADVFIEEMDDADAERLVEMIDEMEENAPGTLDAFIKDVEENGFPDDDDSG